MAEHELVTDEMKRTKKVRMGKAELRPMDEVGHYGLFRPVFVDGWDDQRGEFVRLSSEEPLGPLAVFREASRGEHIHMRTFHPVRKYLMELHCVWDPSNTFIRERQD